MRRLQAALYALSVLLTTQGRAQTASDTVAVMELISKSLGLQRVAVGEEGHRLFVALPDSLRPLRPYVDAGIGASCLEGSPRQSYHSLAYVEIRSFRVEIDSAIVSLYTSSSSLQPGGASGEEATYVFHHSARFGWMQNLPIHMAYWDGQQVGSGRPPPSCRGS
jgi:hypothetical protein